MRRKERESEKRPGFKQFLLSLFTPPTLPLPRNLGSGEMWARGCWSSNHIADETIVGSEFHSMEVLAPWKAFEMLRTKDYELHLMQYYSKAKQRRERGGKNVWTIVKREWRSGETERGWPLLISYFSHYHRHETKIWIWSEKCFIWGCFALGHWCEQRHVKSLKFELMPDSLRLQSFYLCPKLFLEVEIMNLNFIIGAPMLDLDTYWHPKTSEFCISYVLCIVRALFSIFPRR